MHVHSCMKKLAIILVLVLIATPVSGKYVASPYDPISSQGTGDTLDTSSSDDIIQGIEAKPDGTKFYAVNFDTNSVYSYTTSDAYDLSSATQENSLSISPTSVQAMEIGDNGTMLYVVGTSNDNVVSYQMSDPYNLSTASQVNSFGVGSEDDYPVTLEFNGNGTKMYIYGNGEHDTYTYDLSTEWDISTASFSSTSTTSLFADNIVWNDNGTTLYALTGDIVAYSASTPYDVSTLTQEETLSTTNSTKDLVWADDGALSYTLTDTIIGERENIKPLSNSQQNATDVSGIPSFKEFSQDNFSQGNNTSYDVIEDSSLEFTVEITRPDGSSATSIYANISKMNVSEYEKVEVYVDGQLIDTEQPVANITFTDWSTHNISFQGIIPPTNTYENATSLSTPGIPDGTVRYWASDDPNRYWADGDANTTVDLVEDDSERLEMDITRDTGADTAEFYINTSNTSVFESDNVTLYIDGQERYYTEGDVVSFTIKYWSTHNATFVNPAGTKAPEGGGGGGDGIIFGSLFGIPNIAIFIAVLIIGIVGFIVYSNGEIEWGMN